MVLLLLQMHSELDGKDALAWINGSKVLPDLILLDCMMPNMTGEPAACLHRRTSQAPRLPVWLHLPEFPDTNQGMKSAPACICEHMGCSA